MTLDLDALRYAAEKKQKYVGLLSDQKYSAIVNPTTLLALLDRLARAERLLAEYGVDVS